MGKIRTIYIKNKNKFDEILSNYGQMKKFDKKSKFCAPLFYDEKIIIISNDTWVMSKIEEEQ